MPIKPKVSIIIVYYWKIEHLFDCLKSIKESKAKITYEIIVVNNSQEKNIKKRIYDQYPSVNYIDSGKNIGFGAGQNLGARCAKGDFIFVLNPDTKIYPETLDKLTNYLQNNRNIGIVAPILVDNKNQPFEIQGTGELSPIVGIMALSFLNKYFKNTSLLKKYWLPETNRLLVKTVSFVQGSAFLIRKILFNKLGGFDEKYFLYFEDNDLCKRVIDSGFKIMILSEAKVMHLWGGSTPKSKEIKQIFIQSRFRYFHKHYGIVWAIIVGFFTGLSKWHLIIIFLVFLLFFYKFI